MQFVGGHISKEDRRYIDKLVENKTYTNTSAAIRGMIRYYKENQGFAVEMPEQFTSFAYNFYKQGIPFIFGCLFAYFAILRSWFFIPFLMVAAIPFLFPITVKDRIIKVIH